MSHELVYTSAPRGLKPGSRGFCTVLSTQGMPAPLAATLESLSGYRPLFTPADTRAADNPVVWSYLKVSAVGRTIPLLSRIADCGLDYSQRANKLAHHIALDSNELLSGGPANLLRSPGLLRSSWSDEPRVVPPRAIRTETTPPSGICTAWKSITGDAGWAGVLAESFLADPERSVILLFAAGQDILPLFAEAISLLPADQRWNVTFSTYFTSLAPGVKCVWRAMIHDSKEAHESLRQINALRIDLTSSNLGPATGGPLVTAARTGVRPHQPPPRLPPTASAALQPVAVKENAPQGEVVFAEMEYDDQPIEMAAAVPDLPVRMGRVMAGPPQIKPHNIGSSLSPSRGYNSTASMQDFSRKRVYFVAATVLILLVGGLILLLPNRERFSSWLAARHDQTADERKAIGEGGAGEAVKTSEVLKDSMTLGQTKSESETPTVKLAEQPMKNGLGDQPNGAVEADEKKEKEQAGSNTNPPQSSNEDEKTEDNLPEHPAASALSAINAVESEETITTTKAQTSSRPDDDASQQKQVQIPFKAGDKTRLAELEKRSENDELILWAPQWLPLSVTKNAEGKDVKDDLMTIIHGNNTPVASIVSETTALETNKTSYSLVTRKAPEFQSLAWCQVQIGGPSGEITSFINFSLSPSPLDLKIGGTENGVKWKLPSVEYPYKEWHPKLFFKRITIQIGTKAYLLSPMDPGAGEKWILTLADLMNAVRDDIVEEKQQKTFKPKQDFDLHVHIPEDGQAIKLQLFHDDVLITAAKTSLMKELTAAIESATMRPVEIKSMLNKMDKKKLVDEPDELQIFHEKFKQVFDNEKSRRTPAGVDLAQHKKDVQDGLAAATKIKDVIPRAEKLKKYKQDLSEATISGAYFYYEVYSKPVKGESPRKPRRIDVIKFGDAAPDTTKSDKENPQ